MFASPARAFFPTISGHSHRLNVILRLILKFHAIHRTFILEISSIVASSVVIKMHAHLVIKIYD